MSDDFVHVPAKIVGSVLIEGKPPRVIVDHGTRVKLGLNWIPVLISYRADEVILTTATEEEMER